MVFIVVANKIQTPLHNLDDANTFALDTGLGFPDVVIIDTETDCIDEMERFLK